jgi:threonine dehydratase
MTKVNAHATMAQISTCPPLVRESVVNAHKLIKDHVHYTPVMTNWTLKKLASPPRESALPGGRRPANPTMRLHFKCENLQRGGAFKVRGAFHALERLMKEPGWIENGKGRKVSLHSVQVRKSTIRFKIRD